MLKKDIITGNAFRDICDDYIDEDKPYISIIDKPKIIFLKTDWIEIFKLKVLPFIDYSFKLITHNADRSAVSGNLDLLEDSRLIKWFGMNVDIIHPKLQPIPIGIANEKWPHGNKDVLLKVINENNEKKNLVYCNFDITTNFNKRNNTINLLKSNTHQYIDFESSKLSFESYVRKLSTYKFTISPPGNSIDCHRIWESIYLGVIPVVEKHSALEYWYDLPILFVESFELLNEKLLHEQYDAIVNRSNEKAFFNHYKKIIL
jgi:hypothetical protein